MMLGTKRPYQKSTEAKLLSPKGNTKRSSLLRVSPEGSPQKRDDASHPTFSNVDSDFSASGSASPVHRDAERSVGEGHGNYILDKEGRNNIPDYCMQEREVREGITIFFEKLEKKLKKNANAKTDFYDVVKKYVEKMSIEKKKGPYDKYKDTNFLLQVLDFVKRLSSMSDADQNSNLEKLKVYISVLTSQLNLHNQSYFMSLQIAKQIKQEINYLQANNHEAWKMNKKWLQIHKGLTSSEIKVEVQSASKLVFSGDPPNPSCLVRFGGIKVKQTQSEVRTYNPNWNANVTLEITQDQSEEGLSFEVYDHKRDHVFQIGECFVSMEDILDNTLFRNPFVMYKSISQTPGHNTEENGEPDQALKQINESIIENLICEGTEKEVEKHLDSLFKQGESTGILKLKFKAALDPSFAGNLAKLRETRLQNLRKLKRKNDSKLDKQFDFLKDVAETMKTFDVDYKMGLIPIEVEKKEKERDSGCGGCLGGRGGNCNMF